jgi:hypothetical protein
VCTTVRHGTFRCGEHDLPALLGIRIATEGSAISHIRWWPEGARPVLATSPGRFGIPEIATRGQFAEAGFSSRTFTELRDRNPAVCAPSVRFVQR